MIQLMTVLFAVITVAGCDPRLVEYDLSTDVQDVSEVQRDTRECTPIGPQPSIFECQP